MKFMKLNMRIEFVANAVNALNIVRCFGRDLEFMSAIADMIINCPAGIVIKAFMPYEVYYHIVS